MSKVVYNGNIIVYPQDTSEMVDRIKCSVISPYGEAENLIISNELDFKKKYGEEVNDNTNMLLKLLSDGYKLLSSRHLTWNKNILKTYDLTTSLEIKKTTLQNGFYFKFIFSDKNVVIRCAYDSFKKSPQSLELNDYHVLTDENNVLSDLQFILKEYIVDLIIKENSIVFNSYYPFILVIGEENPNLNKSAIRFFQDDIYSSVNGVVTKITNEFIEITSNLVVVNVEIKENYIVAVNVGQEVVADETILFHNEIWGYSKGGYEYQDSFIQSSVISPDEMNSTVYSYATKIKTHQNIAIDSSEFILLNNGFVNDLIAVVATNEDTNITPILYTQTISSVVTYVDEKTVTYEAGGESQTVVNTISTLFEPKVVVGDVIYEGQILFDYKYKIESGLYNTRTFVTLFNIPPIRFTDSGIVLCSDNVITQVANYISDWDLQEKVKDYDNTKVYQKNEYVISIFNNTLSLFYSNLADNKNHTPNDVDGYWTLVSGVSTYSNINSYLTYSKVIVTDNKGKHHLFIANKITTSNPLTSYNNTNNSFISHVKDNDIVKRGQTNYYFTTEVIDEIAISKIISSLKNKGFNVNSINNFIYLKKNVRYKVLDISTFEIEDDINGSYDVFCSHYNNKKTIEFSIKQPCCKNNFSMVINKYLPFEKKFGTGYYILINNGTVEKEQFYITFNKQSKNYIENEMKNSKLIDVNLWNDNCFLPVGTFEFKREEEYELQENEMLCNLENSYQNEEYEIVIDDNIKNVNYIEKIKDLYIDSGALLLLSLIYNVIEGNTNIAEDDYVEVLNYNENDFTNIYNTVYSYPYYYYENYKYPAYYSMLHNLMISDNYVGEYDLVDKLDSELELQYKDLLLTLDYDNYRYVITQNYIYDNLISYNYNSNRQTVPDLTLTLIRIKNFVVPEVDYQSSIKNIKNELQSLCDKINDRSEVIKLIEVNNVVKEQYNCSFDITIHSYGEIFNPIILFFSLIIKQ